MTSSNQQPPQPCPEWRATKSRWGKTQGQEKSLRRCPCEPQGRQRGPYLSLVLGSLQHGSLPNNKVHMHNTGLEFILCLSSQDKSFDNMTSSLHNGSSGESSQLSYNDTKRWSYSVTWESAASDGLGFRHNVHPPKHLCLLSSGCLNFFLWGSISLTISLRHYKIYQIIPGAPDSACNWG